MSNDPTPEAVEAALAYLELPNVPTGNEWEAFRSKHGTVIDSIGTVHDMQKLVCKAVRALRTRLTECTTKLAEVEAERDALTREVEGFKNNNRFHRGHSYGYQEAKEKYGAELAELRAALTSQQEAMDTAVRALEKAREYVSSERELIGLDEGEEVAESSDASIALRSIDAALAQLRASRLSQFPENGKDGYQRLFDHLTRKANEPTAKTDGGAMT